MSNLNKEYIYRIRDKGLSEYIAGNFDVAEKYWKSIEQTGYFEIDNDLKVKLGCIAIKKSDAVQDKQSDDFKTYRKQALGYWQGVQLDKNDPLAYATAQVNIGMVYSDSKDYEEAEHCYLNVFREMDNEQYARAQLQLGGVYLDENNSKYSFNSAKECFNNIKPSDISEAYNQAQYNLGWIGIKENDIDAAKSSWNNIIYSQDNILFKKIFSDLMDVFWANVHSIGFSYIKDYINKTDKYRDFYHEIMLRITSCEQCIQQEVLHKFFNEIRAFIKVLHLGNTIFSEHDSSFAHYTCHTTALRVMDKEKSAFRLSSMHFMNDPTEGNLINKLLDIDVSNPDKDSRHLAFASCFSFNHNSLNQFRLYGKTDGQENSGVSLVFNKGFFQMDMSENTNIDASIARVQSVSSDISNIFFTDKKQDISSITTTLDEPEKICLYQEKQKKEIEKVEKQPLYRCIYVDPESGYLRVARRSKISFFRSPKTKENAQHIYAAYVQTLDKADEEINGCISYLKKLVTELKESLKDEPVEYQKWIWALVNDILLPLRYLIKHAAFEEEEECRMIYITDMCDPKIQSDPEKKWLYVEYAEPVKDHIKKVYLGDGAKDYRPFFERALADKSNVKDSNNPFRA